MNTELLANSIATMVNFLNFLSMATPLVLGLVGMLAYYYREKLKSLLSKSVAHDIEKLKADLAKQIADHTSALHRDLEAYKVGLIAETERIKASQDIRKSMALKVSEKRFLAIAALFEAHMGIDTSIGAHVTFRQSQEQYDIDFFMKDRSELHERFSKYTTASDNAILFISSDLRNMVLAVRKAALDVLALRMNCQSAPVPNDSQELATLLRCANELEQALRQILAEFEQA